MKRNVETTREEDERLLALAIAFEALRPPSARARQRPVAGNVPAGLQRQKHAPTASSQGSTVVTPVTPATVDQASADAAPVAPSTRAAQSGRAAETQPRRPKPRRRPVRLGRADIPLIEQLARTGFAAARHTRFANVGEKRVRALVRAGFLERGHTVVSAGEGRVAGVSYVRLTRKSRAFARRYLDLVIYQTNPRQAAHDLRLADIYWSLGAAERATWKTEQEVIEMLKREGNYERGHGVDAAIEVAGEAVAVEVAVGYDARRLAMKRATIARHFGGRALLLTAGGL